MRVTLLGTGTSTGVPVIGCTCPVCRSTDPRDRRLRCACYIEVGGLHLVIDAGPDFRQQALRAGIERVDAVLVTHHHFDHIAGLDDLRPFFFGNLRPIPCYTLHDTAEVLRRMYNYIFVDRSYPGVPKLNLVEVDGPFEVVSRYAEGRAVRVEPVEVFHGEMPVLGYRVGRFAYVTDTNNIPDHSLARLRGLDVLVLDGLRHEPHRTHFTIEAATRMAQRIGARQTYLIHMTHNILHDEADALLPDGVNLGYDGLTFDVLPLDPS